MICELCAKAADSVATGIYPPPDRQEDQEAQQVPGGNTMRLPAPIMTDDVPIGPTHPYNELPPGKLEVSGWLVIDQRAQLEWAQKQLARYTYKPGYRMSIDTTGEMLYASVMYGGDMVFRVAFDAPDARDPSRTIPLVFSCIFNSVLLDDQDEARFAIWLQERLEQMERHESREWLRRDGVIYDDPHKGV